MKANKGRFKKGASGNPRGRPKGAAGLAAVIRNKTRKGRALVEYCVRVVAGKEVGYALDKFGAVVEVPPSVKERMAAVEWLAERGWGKAADTGELDTQPIPTDMDTATVPLIAAAREILAAQVGRFKALKDAGVGLSEAQAGRLTECVKQIALLNDEELKLIKADPLAGLDDNELRQRLAEAERRLATGAGVQ